MATSVEASLTLREALSGITGSISLASWIVVLVPQLYENYSRGNSDGVSIAFLVVWLVGDFTNLIGAVWAGLVPTVIALAIYFCIADVVLLSQCVYYTLLNRTGSLQDALADPSITGFNDPQQPLLGGQNNENTGLPGSRRRSSASQNRQNLAHTQDVLSAESSSRDSDSARQWLRNILSVFLIILAGSAGWALAWLTGAWRPSPVREVEVTKAVSSGAELLGYFSAICYVGARLPQIYKNYQEKSCEGLSLLFFVLSTIGNATYGAGILFHSTEKSYVLINLPWLIGSLGTMAEDAIIFVQFHLYRSDGEI